MNAALLALVLTQSAGSNGEDLADTAQREFRAGCESRDDAATARPHFAKAALHYRELWERNPASVELAQRWARAEFLGGNLPGAIAAAHAGLRIAPHHAGLQRDLETYRDAVIDPASPKSDERLRPPRIAGVRARVSEWDLFGAASAGVALTVIGMFRRFTVGSAWATPLAIFGAMVLLLCAGLAWVRHSELADDRAIPLWIVGAEATLRKGNGESYLPRIEAPVPRGAEVREISRRGGWVQIRVAGGAIGWLPEGALLPIP